MSRQQLNGMPVKGIGRKQLRQPRRRYEMWNFVESTLNILSCDEISIYMCAMFNSKRNQ